MNRLYFIFTGLLIFSTVFAHVRPLSCNKHNERLSRVSSEETIEPSENPVFYTLLKKIFPEDGFVEVASINQFLAFQKACTDFSIGFSGSTTIESEIRWNQFAKEQINVLLEMLNRYKTDFHETEIALPKELKNDEYRLDYIYYGSAKYDPERYRIDAKKKFLQFYKPEKVEDIPQIETKILSELAEVERQLQFAQNFQKRIANEGGFSPEILGLFNLYFRMKSVSLRLRNRIGSRTCGLTDIELFLLHEYSRYLYRPVNEALYSGNLDRIKELQPVIQILNQGLNKLEPYVGVVTRTTDFPAKVDLEHAPDRTVFYQAFTSTSINRRVTKEGVPYLLEIQSRTGRYIAPLAERQDEEEVLFPTGLKLRIAKRVGNTIYMEELP